MSKNVVIEGKMQRLDPSKDFDGKFNECDLECSNTNGDFALTDATTEDCTIAQRRVLFGVKPTSSIKLCKL